MSPDPLSPLGGRGSGEEEAGLVTRVQQVLLKSPELRLVLDLPPHARVLVPRLSNCYPKPQRSGGHLTPADL